MAFWRRLKDRITGRSDADLDRELHAHLDLEAEEQQGAGLLDDEARFAARRAFGNVTLVKEEVREMWGWSWLERLLQDVRYALRMMRKNPGFTATAVLILGLGIGANSAIFSVANAVLLRPLPYRDAHRLVQVWETNPRANRWGQWVSYPDFLDWREQNRVFEDIAAFRPWPWRITGDEHPELLAGLRVTSNLFSLLDVQPMFGRSFQTGEDEPGHHLVVILGYGLWQRRFGSDPGIVGQTVTLDGQKHTVIGIMPPSLDFPRDVGARNLPDVWVPVGGHPERQDRGSHNFRVVGRLKPDVTIEQAQANMESIAASIGERHQDHRGRSALVAGLQRNATREVRPALLLLLGAIGFVLLIACANIANLQLARATTPGGGKPPSGKPSGPAARG